MVPLIDKSLIFTIGGAVAGAVVYGFLGALIGGLILGFYKVYEFGL